MRTGQTGTVACEREIYAWKRSRSQPKICRYVTQRDLLDVGYEQMLGSKPTDVHLRLFGGYVIGEDALPPKWLDRLSH